MRKKINQLGALLFVAVIVLGIAKLLGILTFLSWLLKEYPVVITAISAIVGAIYILQKQQSNIDQQLAAKEELTRYYYKKEKVETLLLILIDFENKITSYGEFKEIENIKVLQNDFYKILAYQKLYELVNSRAFKKYYDITSELLQCLELNINKQQERPIDQIKIFLDTSKNIKHSLTGIYLPF